MVEGEGCVADCWVADTHPGHPVTSNFEDNTKRLDQNCLYKAVQDQELFSPLLAD